MIKKVYRKIKNEYQNISSFLKMTLLFEAILIVSFVLTMMFVTKRFSVILREKEIELGEKRVENLADFAQEEYNRIYSLRNYIHNSEISTILAKISRDEQEAYQYKNIQDIQVFFSGISYADENISDIVLISKFGNVYSYTRQASYEVNPSYSFLEDEEIREFLTSGDDVQIRYVNPTKYCIREREAVVSYMGKIFDASLFPQKELVGIYFINIPLLSFEEIQKGSSGVNQGDLYLLNKNDEVLYCSDSLSCGKTADMESKAADEGIWVITRNLGSSGIRAYYVLSENIMFSHIVTVRNQVMGVVVFAIIVTTLLGYILYHVFQKKMTILLDSMQELQQGNFQTRLPVSSQDEIGRISESFNVMCEKLNAYVGRVYRAEIQRKNAEINALQTQINPHFLYNTLESIKSNAIMNHDEDTAEMITLLGNLFRWISRTDEKIISLEKELEYIRNYLRLQSYRYNRKLEVSIEVEEDFLDEKIPKLILQPLVENAIKHALDEVNRDKLIGIQVRKKKDVLEITVYDNGIGITTKRLEEIKEELQSSENQDEFESIGLKNVNQRLKLMYGPEYGLQINSIEEYGTAVKIRIPAGDMGEE